DALVRGVFLFPGARLHLVEARAHDDLDVVAADAPRGAAAVPGGGAAAQHDDPLADLRGVAEGNRGEPVDADVDVLRALPAARDVEVSAARCAGADEDGVVALLHQRLHRFYF